MQFMWSIRKPDESEFFNIVGVGLITHLVGIMYFLIDLLRMPTDRSDVCDVFTGLCSEMDYVIAVSYISGSIHYFNESANICNISKKN